MGWWSLLGGKEEGKHKETSELDKFVPPPPGGCPLVAPPEAPRGFTSRPSSVTPEFTGFTPPPPVFSSPPRDYSQQDLSRYASPYRESDGLRDSEHSRQLLEGSWADRNISNPRARQCYDNVKMGMKMGAAVGGIFGGLTGAYASFAHRSLILLPISTVGGAASFGFFLGCGMIVRC